MPIQSILFPKKKTKKNTTRDIELTPIVDQGSDDDSIGTGTSPQMSLCC